MRNYRLPITALALLALILLTVGPSAHGEALNASIYELEPSLAIPLELGPSAALRGSIGQADNSQLYRLEATPGNTYVIEIFDVTSGPGLGTSLTVYDAEGRYLSSGMGGWGNVDRHVTLAAPTASPLYIRVAKLNGWSGDYSLRALARFDQDGAAWGEDLEPNDLCELATLLLPGAEAEPHLILTTPHSVLTHYPDVDSYRFNAEPGEIYEVLVEGLPANSPPGAVGLYLLDMSSGEFLSFDAQARSRGSSVSLAYHFEQGGEVCARIGGAFLPSTWTGPYTVRLCEGRCTRSVLLPFVRL